MNEITTNDVYGIPYKLHNTISMYNVDNGSKRMISSIFVCARRERENEKNKNKSAKY